MTDHELLRLLQSGELSAWGSLFDRYFPMTWRYAVAVTRGDKSLADDIASETMMTLASHVANIDLKNGSLADWITGVVRHKVSDFHRRADRSFRAAQAIAPRIPNDDAITDASAPLETEETRDRVLGTLEKMAPDERLALDWKYVEGLSVAQIALRLGRSEKATQSLLYRSRRAFRSLFDCRQEIEV